MSINSKKDTCNVLCFNKIKVSKIKRVMPAISEIENAADIFSILGDKTRIKIIIKILKKEWQVVNKRQCNSYEQEYKELKQGKKPHKVRRPVSQTGKKETAQGKSQQINRQYGRKCIG